MDHITFRRMQSSRQFQNHTEQCYLAKKKPVVSANEMTSTFTCIANVEFFLQCTPSITNLHSGRKKSCFDPSSYLMWPCTISLQWALFLVFVWRPVKAKEVWGKMKSALCRDCNSWCHVWDTATRHKKEANRCHQPTPRTKYFFNGRMFKIM